MADEGTRPLVGFIISSLDVASLVNPCSTSQSRPKWDVGFPDVVSFVDP
jgi:hypothetical protein